MSETIGRTFVLMVTFLGVFAVLVNAMPTAFLYGGDREELVYADWQAANLFMANVTCYANATAAKGTTPIIDDDDWSPSNVYDVWLRIPWSAGSNDSYYQRWWWVIYPIWWDYAPIEPYPLTPTYIISQADSETDNLTDTFVMSDEAYSYYVTIGFNSTDYGNWSAVFADPSGEYQAYIYMGYEDNPSTISAWNIVSRLLLFQVPEIHPYLNAIIALPLYAAIGYLAYRFILWAIPFLGG